MLMCWLNRGRISPVVSGISSSPLPSVMGCGGLYVLGGANLRPQAAAPLFTGLRAALTAGGRPRRLPAGPLVAGGDGEERVGEHRQGDVPVPSVPFADLVMIQPGLVLGLGEAVLHFPPGPSHR